MTLCVFAITFDVPYEYIWDEKHFPKQICDEGHEEHLKARFCGSCGRKLRRKKIITPTHKLIDLAKYLDVQIDQTPAEWQNFANKLFEINGKKAIFYQPIAYTALNDESKINKSIIDSAFEKALKCKDILEADGAINFSIKTKES